jgi:hypothetical protein
MTWAPGGATDAFAALSTQSKPAQVAFGNGKKPSGVQCVSSWSERANVTNEDTFYVSSASTPGALHSGLRRLGLVRG